MKKKLFLILFLLVFVNMPVFASKLPDDVWAYVQKNLKGAKQRFDSVIILNDNLMYVPLYPTQKAVVEKLEIVYTYPSSKSLSQKPEVVIFNNNYVLLKVFKNKAGRFQVTNYDALPVKVKLGVMPQDMLVPPGLNVPENLRLVLGDLMIPSLNKAGVQGGVGETIQPVKIGNIPELKNKKMFATTRASRYLLAVDAGNQSTLYELRLRAVPIDIAVSESLKFGAAIYYNSKFVDILDLKNERIISQIELEGIPDSISIDSKNNIAYISSSSANTIYALELTSMKLVRKIKVSNFPDMLFVSEDGKFLVYRDKFSGDLFLQYLSGEYVSNYVMPTPNLSFAKMSGEDLYSLSRSDNTLSIIDPYAKVLKGELKTGAKPVDMVFYKNKIYVLCAGGSLINVFEKNTGKLIKNIAVDKTGFYTKITPVRGSSLLLISGIGADKIVIMDMGKDVITQKRGVKADITKVIIIDK